MVVFVMCVDAGSREYVRADTEFTLRITISPISTPCLA